MIRFLVLTLISFVLFPAVINGQKIGVGASGMYNFQSEGWGAGVRVNLNVQKKLSLVPQVSYYFPFNKVHEVIIGLGLEYKVFKMRKFYGYGLGYAAYNNWLNSDSSPMEGAEQNNWNLDVGGGLSTYGCLRLFAESRYNVKFRESHVQLGLLYVLGCSPGRGKICPAYQ